MELQVECENTVLQGVTIAEKVMYSVLFEKGDTSQFLTNLMKGENAYVTWTHLDGRDNAGYVNNYWTYWGSETTPDCSELVVWIINTDINEADGD
jgi:carbonic anhydrase